MERNQIEQEAFDFLKELSDSIDESRHTPIVLDVYGEAVDMITAHDARIRAEALKEAATKARNAILDFGKGDTVSSRYSPMIRKEMAAQLAERAILGGTKRE